jgi:hypothetical protein
LAREEKAYDRPCHALSIELREDRARYSLGKRGTHG